MSGVHEAVQFIFVKIKEVHNSVFYLLFYLFIFGCVGSSLLCTGSLQLRRAGTALRCGACASHSVASLAVDHGL